MFLFQKRHFLDYWQIGNLRASGTYVSCVQPCLQNMMRTSSVFFLNKNFPLSKKKKYDEDQLWPLGGRLSPKEKCPKYFSI